MTEIFSSETKLFNLEDVNKNITRFKVPLCYVGIANGFDFSKEVIEGLVDTIKGSPCLTYYDEQAKDFGGHECDLYTSNGVKKRTPPLYPIGFAVYDQNAWWEKFIFDGVEREYYTTFVYLWKNRYPELQNLKQVFQSMEVEIDYDNPIDGIKKVKSASFQGMAMLGSSVFPAFKGSTFIKFSSDDLIILKQEFEQIKIKPSEKLKKVTMSVDDKLGKSPPLKINNSKDAAIMSDSWSDPGADLLNKLLESSNHTSLIEESYLIIDGNNNSDLSINNVHYPHHSLKDNELVVNKKGVESAFARLKQQGVAGEAMTHIKKHYKELGLDMDNFANKQEKKGENYNMEFKQLYSKMKESNSTFAFDDSCGTDESQMTVLIDSDAGYMYLMDGTGGVTKIPFVTADDDYDTFALKEDAKEESNSKEMMSKMSQMYNAEKEKVVAEMSIQLSAKEAEAETQKQEMSAQLSEKDAQLSAKEVEMSEALLSKDAEIGKHFASITSLETAMAESTAVMAQKEAQIEELSKQLKGKETAEKMSKVEDFLSKKEFSVFSAEEKQSFKDKSVEMSLEELETMTYSEFGKKIKDKIDFSSESQKFSFMYVENKPLNSQDGKDVYAEIREKNSK